MSWQNDNSLGQLRSKSRLQQLNEAYCTSVDLEKIREKFKQEPWFIDIFLTTPNHRFPYVHICVLCKKVYKGFESSTVEFIEAIGKLVRRKEVFLKFFCFLTFFLFFRARASKKSV